MTTIQSALQTAAKQLGEITEENRLEAEILLMFSLQKPRSYLHAWPETKLTTAQTTIFRKLIRRRILGEPVAYLTGEKEFWSLPLKVTPNVLIPRPETELLVELALKMLPEKPTCKVADLGTGSGAIALALASERPHWRITATDISPAALLIAKQNASRLGLQQITFLAGDWCDALGDHDYDLIISNPPYVAAGDPHLEHGGLPFEPEQALASGYSGLDDIEKIIRQTGDFLRPGGWLMLEHGYDQETSVQKLLADTGYQAIQCHRDLAGLPRATVAKRARAC